MASGETGGRLAIWKTRVEILSAVVTILGALAAGLWALHEYNDSQDRARIEATLAYRKQYDGEPLFAARRVVDRAWLGAADESAELRKKRDWKAYAELVARLARQPDFTLSLTTILGFYDELYVCMRDRICDRGTAVDLFGKDALTYRDADYPFIESERKRRSYPYFGCGIDRIGTMFDARVHGEGLADESSARLAACF